MADDEDDWRRNYRRFVAFVNGWLLILGSVLVTPIAITQGVEEYGAIGFLAGGTAGLIWFVPGVLAVRYAKRGQ